MKPRSFRMSDDEYAILTAKAEKAGMKVGEYCRGILLSHEVRDTLPRQEIAKTMCVYHNHIDDAKTLTELKYLLHQMEAQIWQLIG